LSPFDWRRRLTMQLAYATSNDISSVNDLIEGYESKLSSGTVPYPLPAYMSSQERREVQCVLYRILRLGGHTESITTRDVINPSGHTDCDHDFSLAFHLASAVTATDLAVPMSSEEEHILIDGYVAQLVSAGHWEWAVYASLCSFDNSLKSSSGRKSLAKTLVLRNYEGGSMNTKREFLEGLLRKLVRPWSKS